MSGFAADLAAAIGNTPLITLRRASEATGCTILGKAEFMNPGGSVKDRAGLAIIVDAEQRGTLLPGGTLVEGTAGNTGIGLTLVGNARGYRSVIVMPETQSQEKIDFLRMIGADLRLVPPSPTGTPAITCMCPAGWPGNWARSGPINSIIWRIVRATGQPQDPRFGRRRRGGLTPSPVRAGRAARWAACHWR